VRLCTKCGRTLPEECFPYYATPNWCKECKNEYDRQYKKRRRESSADSYRSDEMQRARTYYHSIGQKRRDDRLGKYKTPCAKCGETRIYCLAFHHIDPKTKLFCIGGGTKKVDDEALIAEEVKKCVCLCENCHREYHHFYGHRPKDTRAALEEYLGMKLPTFEEKENENA